jgi:hypothetical protein
MCSGLSMSSRGGGTRTFERCRGTLASTAVDLLDRLASR